MDYIYLHGFASSPNSAKARDISDHFTQIHTKLKIPDLNVGDFSQLTITRQIAQVAAEFNNDSTPVTLIGSSLGGLTAAHLGQQNLQVQRLVLLAPAFGFLSHWLPKLGDEEVQRWQQEKSIMVYHYGEERLIPLSYDFVIDAAQYQEKLLQRPISTLILHGKKDEVIPIEASRDFARSRPWVELVELDSDHALGNVMEEIWQAIRLFCQLP
ncbi:MULTISPECIES: YqiA/YcfP family alpha/beta fold hydrolase [unclassified Nostoc]|uniref:YqiA/YcfP family alpha/beta fold hydrolase n=1 Tax=unclassified Nostoc TaxID=2593658 RepID=UPI0025AAE38C|nr:MULTISPECIES: YqiA/YcfP family alpha/beta fold hydrolase [unclassified Nostoc]MDM9585342.1 YqiA/YcfP family alpha/beta fold hydrolase [Nostoc sp. GT001]MDZ7949266.1 YqiA/YcfP family alpha/beta fold hydrolase [Nostoc sp. EfeVER01]MDZ7995721.1 YqiA/YcfP family alpha/beta fold hydrolase [Nostoc sp. EspVER01]